VQPSKAREAEIDERILYVESNWKRTAMQLDSLQQVWSVLDEEHQNIQNRVLRMLVSNENTVVGDPKNESMS
jgi:hypothetical protein